MVTQITKSGAIATSKIELANKVKEILAGFDRDAKDDKHFRELVLEYFKPEIKY